MQPEPAIRDALLAAVPSLRAFAISLCGQVDRADDLVQDTLLRALSHIDRFERGTNLNAWLFTILRNLFHSEYRKRRREVEDPDAPMRAVSRSSPNRARGSISKISEPPSRNCLTTSARRFSSSEPRASPTRRPRISAAAPSAPSRAASTAPLALANLAVDDVEDLGPDRMTRAALQAIG